MDDRFRLALNHLYKTFHAPCPREIVGCPCCLDRKGIKTLHSKLLHDLTPNDLSSYASSVFLTVGDIPDFRYFLPRIMEISATDDGWWPSPEVALGKLTLAGWSRWPEMERQAILEFIDAWFCQWAAKQQVEDNFREGPDLGALICGMARAEIGLKTYLAKLLPYPNALKSVYLGGVGERSGNGRFVNGFWDEHDDAATVVVSFINSEAAQAEMWKD